jgi:glucose-6-phosphate-specific signal transduction histidine kinase
MSIETYITASMLLGFALGMWISRTAIRERDKRISELEKEITIKQNVADALNATVQRLRKKLKRKENEYQS